MLEQSQWLNRYNNLHTEKRKKTYKSYSFNKDFIKLMNNNLYGKTIENLRNKNN